MTAMTFQLLGGIGLFLLGMVLLTDGLKAFAGDALRRALVRFTGTPLKAFGSGALVTAMVQSSSATTVTLIGFVSAGLITFPQAVGVVMGASLGTTGTGWIVSVLGLKVSVGFYALPLVGVGAFMRLLGNGRWKSLGLALAGFGLIFVGIENLQQGMHGLAGVFDLGALPTTGLWGHLLVMVIGILMTVVMQSSSAAVATTLTALHTGTVSFEQAAALVIGAAIGTTVTGALAAIGGSVPAKRTAFTHVLFNLATGLIAIALLPVFLWGLGLGQKYLGLEPGAVSLAAFHTAFIAFGVLLFLPFAEGIARRIERLLPDRGPHLTRHLDDSLLQAPPVALEATRRTLSDTARELFGLLRAVLRGNDGSLDDPRRPQIAQALEQTRDFFARIPPVREDEALSHARVEQMHAIDHLIRLHERSLPPAAVQRMLTHDKLQPAVEHCRSVIEQAQAGLFGHTPEDWLNRIEQQVRVLEELHQQERLTILHSTAGGEWGPVEALAALETLRWLERVALHAWRICNHLGNHEIPRASDMEDAAPGDPPPGTQP